ncbi:hypothetical protein, partial [Nitrosospira multiformis]|uniref:hypothetical protein n=1 Tax=Nitrosospira multiformis TaxID=1231 RepID=UPI001C43614B
ICPSGKGKHLVRQARGAGTFHFRPVLISGAGQDSPNNWNNWFVRGVHFISANQDFPWQIDNKG